MISNPTILCVILSDIQFQSDWTTIGYRVARPRATPACFMNVYQYDAEHNPVAIDDWATAKQENAIRVGILLTFSELTGLLLSLVPREQGLFVYSGDVPPPCGSVSPAVPDQLRAKAKICQASPYPQYAASYASSLSEVIGFDPDPCPGCHFTLAWFPSNDPVMPEILRRWDAWPDSTCQAMLPRGPSPSDRSVELVIAGHDQHVIGLYVDDLCQQNLQEGRLRQIIGESAMLARLGDADFWQWLESGCSLDQLIPVDRDLPFQR